MSESFEMVSLKGNKIAALGKQEALGSANATKSKILPISNVLNGIDLEVPKVAVTQFPELAKTAREMLTDYMDVAKTALDGNSKSVGRAYDVCDAEMAALSKQLEKKDITPEVEKLTIEAMDNAGRRACERDTENKHLLMWIVDKVTSALCFALAGLLAFLGIRAFAKVPKSDQ